MDELKDIREQITEIDDELSGLIVRRMEAVKRVAEIKAENKLPIFDPAREREVINGVTGRAGAEFETPVKVVYSSLLDVSRTLQRSAIGVDSPLRSRLNRAVADERPLPGRAAVACQGVEGAYSQQACERLFEYADLVYFNRFDAVFSAVDKGMCPYGILPIENSLAGSVAQVYQLLEQYRFHIVRACRQRIDHVLLGKRGARLSDIREVISHPHALNQCAAFLKSHPEITANPADNTAVAAKAVAASERTDLACIASRACAATYGLEVLSDAVSDSDNNYTRFIVIQKEMMITQDADKISLIVTLKHRPGSLYQVMSRFAALDLNLTKLESRPAAGKDFEFNFHFDLEGSVRDARVLELLSDLSLSADRLIFLGNYHEI